MRHLKNQIKVEKVRLREGRRTFLEWEIPVLNINREYLMGGVARFKTRVEAFVEQILVS